MPQPLLAGLIGVDGSNGYCASFEDACTQARDIALSQKALPRPSISYVVGGRTGSNKFLIQ